MIHASIYKEILQNGLTVLVLPRHDIPKVSIQLFYNVGSKDEGAGLWDEIGQEWVNERGIAHFIEHMIFKGTSNLSESDINVLTARLSGYCNAFTSHDYTGYLFDVPAQHWYQVLPVMADCMKNCSFKQEFINSELKAVVQEIKMYNDDYLSTLMEHMMSSIFHDHPYRYPVIGYKQDLWNLKRENLFRFYSKHYGPNNAVLVVVGDVSPTDVFKRANEAFGGIPPLQNYKKRDFFHTTDIIAHNVVIHRDVQQSMLLYCWEVPGMRTKMDYLFDLMSWVVGAGKGAHLYTKLVTEMGIATELQSFVYDLFDCGLFFIYVQPRSQDDILTIRQTILSEIEKFRTQEISDDELQRAQRKTNMDLLNLNEDNQKLGYLLGRMYLATGDENYLLNYGSCDQKTIKQDIQQLFRNHFHPSMMQSGMVLPLSAQDKIVWTEQQQRSDEEDQRILGAIIREDVVEDATYANSIVVENPVPFIFPKPHKFVLPNGLTVLYHHKPELAKLDLIIDLKSKHFYDSADQQGLSMFVADLLQEGTKNYSAVAFANELERYGMELNTFPGQIGMTMLSSDIKKGLELLTDVLMNPIFEPEVIERIRTQLLSELKMFWDTPREYAGQLIREKVYNGHPYSQNIMGDAAAIQKMTRDDISAAYKRAITPQGARLAIVGDLSNVDVKRLFEETVGAWNGPVVADKEFPPLDAIKAATYDFPANRDQTVLVYGGLSVDRFNQDYDDLLLFDQIFTGGVLGSMNSRLFELRERSGLFYTIGGSLLAGVDRQPGMVYIKTILSNDRLLEAEKAIEEVINKGADDFTPQELDEAQRAIINSLVDNFATNRQTAATFIFLDKYQLPDNYFDIRLQQLLMTPLEDIKQAVKKYLDTNKLIKIRIGRLRK